MKISAIEPRHLRQVRKLWRRGWILAAARRLFGSGLLTVGFGKRQSGCHGSLTAGTQDCGDSAGRAIADARARVLRSGAQYVERRCVGQASQSIGARVADKDGLAFIGE